MTRTPSKKLTSLASVVEKTGLRSGQTISFHHHLRNGDGVVNLVLDGLASLGIGDLRLAVTSLFPVHAPLVEHIKSGVVREISSSFLSGPVANAISAGTLASPVLLRSHGGRARALDLGDERIDLAFVAASAADPLGNLTGRSGPCSFGPMGYPQVDADRARHVIGVTDTIVNFPLYPIDIPQHKVSGIWKIAQIGDPEGIASGTTRPGTDNITRAIADQSAAVIAASGLLKSGFAFQTGAGGISLATAEAVGQRMARDRIRGSFTCGGITGTHARLLDAGLFEAILDVQCFDLEAVASSRHNLAHQGMSASAYAGPHVGGAVVDALSAVVLGAAEVDEAFNVNVTTRADGGIIGGSGGHADAAQGADLTLITTRLTAAGFAKIVPKTITRTTPGRDVDVVVTEAGIAVNPAREDLLERLKHAGLPVVSIHDLRKLADQDATRNRIVPREGRVVAVSENRDGTPGDAILQNTSG